EVDRGLLPHVRDWVRPPLDLGVLCGLEAAVAQLLEEREQPLLPRKARAGGFGLEALARVLESCPRGQEAVPASAGGFVGLFAVDKVVGLGGEAVDALL